MYIHRKPAITHHSARITVHSVNLFRVAKNAENDEKSIYKRQTTLYTISLPGRAAIHCQARSDRHAPDRKTAVNADYPRDLIGYGANPPHPHWPGDARIALSFVLNYEEGGERNILHGDKESEAFLSEMVAAQPLQGQRNLCMESLYEYGSRTGVWRLLKLFKKHDIPLTIFAVAMAAQRHPEVIREMVTAGHEICSHGYRWIDYQNMDEATEREHMLEAIRILTELTGERPLGWYTGRLGPNTRRIVREEGGFLYDSDTYDDDLPYWPRPAPQRSRTW